MAYFLLFLQSFLAATIIPFSSEAVLTGMILNDYDATYCLIAASLGNWLGGMSSYGLGYLGKIEWIEKYFRVKHSTILKWEDKVNRFGSYFALLCWLPLIGDVIAIALGLFKTKVMSTSIYMFIGKFLRYLFLIYVFTL